MDSPPDTEPDTDSARFLPYPASTLSPKILPNDLTTYKSRGVSLVQRHFQQRLRELREAYLELVDQFNWNKLIYESKFGFEPNLGETYHLYEMGSGMTLSMIEPGKWPGKKWLGSFELQADGQWKPVEIADSFDLQAWIESQDGDGA